MSIERKDEVTYHCMWEEDCKEFPEWFVMHYEDTAIICSKHIQEASEEEGVHQVGEWSPDQENEETCMCEGCQIVDSWNKVLEVKLEGYEIKILDGYYCRECIEKAIDKHYKRSDI